ncbi:hypothetical protein PSH55_00890 [Pseudoalteromonas sp. Angola-31]|nr:hypothetical protein [Pseudoalteromonas sp. Angola-31]
MNIIKMILVGIISPIIVGLLTVGYINSKADVRVYSSPIISTEFIISGTQNFQQSFTIKNEGNKSAKNIQFSVEGNVIKSKVDKHLAVDGVVEKLQNGDFSLSYPSLNPGSEFTVFILFNEEVDSLPKVSFDEGVATYGAKSSSSDIAITLSAFTIYILFLLSFFRWIYFSSLYFNIDNNFIIKRKSLFITNKEFNNLAEYAIQIICVPSFQSYKKSIFDFKSLENINSLDGKKVHFNDEITKKLESALNKQFIEEMKYALSECTKLNELENFYKLNKPNIITDDIWAKFKKDLRTQIKKMVPSNESFHELNKQILVTLDKGTLEGMSRDEFSEHKKILTQSLPTILVSRLMFSPVLISTVELDEYERELDYLRDYDRARVERFFYILNLLQEKIFDLIWSYKEDTLQTLIKNKPSWVIDKEWVLIEDVIKKLLKSIKVESKTLELIATIQKIPEIHVNTNYDHELLNVESFNSYLERIRTIEVKQRDKDKVLCQREIKVSATEREWNLKVDKLQRQLDSIDQILNRALDVGKIEYPETLFNKENWNNLIKIESILKNID